MDTSPCHWHSKINIKWTNIRDLNAKLLGEVICKKCKEKYKPHCGCNNSSGFHRPNTPHPKSHKSHRFDRQDFGQSTSRNNKIHCITNQKCSLKMAQAEKQRDFFKKNKTGLENLFFFLIGSHKSGYVTFTMKSSTVYKKWSSVKNSICHNNNYSISN